MLMKCYFAPMESLNMRFIMLLCFDEKRGCVWLTGDLSVGQKLFMAFHRVNDKNN